MQGRDATSRAARAWRWSTRTVAIGLALAATGSASAQSGFLYDPGRTLPHGGNECLGVSSCVAVESAATVVDPGKSATVTLWCPSTRPYVTGWDTEQSENLSVRLAPPGVKGTFGEVPPVPNDTGSVVTLLVANHANAPGTVKAFIGCVELPPRISAFRQQRSAVPFNNGVLTPPLFSPGVPR